MKLVFHQQAWDDYLFWQKSNKKIQNRINVLIKECLRAPYAGIGKPEPLRGSLSGWWSRRIDREHRIVYRNSGEELQIAQCRNHY